jgi:hypothetical protein
VTDVVPILGSDISYPISSSSSSRIASESRSLLWGSKLQNTIAVVKTVLIWFFPACLYPATLCAQLSVYSEFARIDGTGHVVAPEAPREILSPALVRNGYTSFQLVVEAASDLHWRLFVGQNPDNAVKVTVYREKGEDLEQVSLPVEGDGAQVFWMDVWAEGTAAVARIKVEPELYIKDDWATYPMEGRVTEARVPEAHPAGVMKNYLCGGPSAVAGDSGIARLRFRNAQQDIALASLGAKDELKKLYGSCDAKQPENPESYLRIRDYLFRLR